MQTGRSETLNPHQWMPGPMGLFIDNPRPMEKNLAIVVLILNIIPLPGLGTLIYNLKTNDDKWVNAIVPMVLALTMFLAIFGLIWAIIDCVKILQAADPDPQQVAPQAQS